MLSSVCIAIGQCRTHRERNRRPCSVVRRVCDQSKLACLSESVSSATLLLGWVSKTCLTRTHYSSVDSLTLVPLGYKSIAVVTSFSAAFR